MTIEQPLRGNVILVVEDDAETLTALAQLIASGLGCRVLTASSGYEALGVIDSGVQVDLVFADVLMPEMDGVTLAHLIRRRLPRLPIVRGCRSACEGSQPTGRFHVRLSTRPDSLLT